VDVLLLQHRREPLRRVGPVPPEPCDCRVAVDLDHELRFVPPPPLHDLVGLGVLVGQREGDLERAVATPSAANERAQLLLACLREPCGGVAHVLGRAVIGGDERGDAVGRRGGACPQPVERAGRVGG